MKRGIHANRLQSEMVLDFVKNSPHPVIVAGDFNSFPYGKTYQQFKSTNLSNSFENSGNGFGYSLNIFPFWVRLDHVFYQNQFFKARKHRVVREVKNSDHFPIWVQLQVKPSK